MKKFYKQLPCLLLALVIAVLPLMVTVPVNAAEEVNEYNLLDFSGEHSTVAVFGDSTLEGASVSYDVGAFPLSYSIELDYGSSNTSSSCYFGGITLSPDFLSAGDYVELEFYFPDYSNSLVSSYEYSCSLLLASSKTGSPSTSQFKVSLSTDLTLGFSNGWNSVLSNLDRLPLFADDLSYESIKNDGAAVGFRVCGTLLSDVTYIRFSPSIDYTKGNAATHGYVTVSFSSYDDLKMTVVSPERPIILDPSDVLSVFSGVGSWLAGAVNNMVSMFWTAEGGLSVLGVLAVASLAIAFIVLLIYLLAGWMKFK